MVPSHIAWLAGQLLASAATAPAEQPVWRLAEIKSLEASGWSAPAEAENRQYRSAKAGRAAVLTVPVWWGEGFRPGEGSVRLLRVGYRDTITQPAVFLARAGVAPYWGFSELHRFGGAGDGKWKTADVPVSWDLICRKNVPGGVTELAISAGADLPIESIALLAPDDRAAGRYFAQTRDWVARVQSAKRASASRGERQEPVIPAQRKGAAIVPYARSWMLPALPNSAPQAGEAGGAVKIRMAQNEYEPGTFAVFANGRGLRGVEYAVGELKGDSGVLKCRLDLRTAEYSAVQETVDYGAAKDPGKYRLYPQRLWPAYPVDIDAGQSHLFWITVQTLGSDSKPGRYAGTITVTGQATDGDAWKPVSAELPIEVEVLPVTLLTMGQARLSLGNCTAGLPTLQEVRTLVECNHTRMDIWFGGTQPQMKVADGKLALDWTYLDDWMAGAAKAGLTEVMWFLGGDPAGFPDTLNLERDLYRARPGDDSTLRGEFLDKTNASPDKVIPELRPLYMDFVRQTAEHAKAKSWPKLILQPFDEPGKWKFPRAQNNPFHKVIGAGAWIQPHFRDCCQLIREGARELPVGLEAHIVEPCIVFLGDVDIFCTNRAYTYPGLAEKLRQAKVQFWQYANCDDQAPPHRMRYGFGFYFGAFDSRGALVWAYNFMSRFDTSAPGNWGSGWYTPFGTVITPALVGLREGLDDRRWIETYRARVGNNPSAAGLLDEIAKQAIDQRAQTKYDSYNEAKDPLQMDAWRKRVADALTAAKPDASP